MLLFAANLFALASEFPTPVASTQWRVNVTAIQNSGAWLSIAEMEMRGSYGGADQCSGGTPSSSVNSPPTAVFDNNTGNQWQSGTGTVPIWIRYVFAAPVYVYEITIKIASNKTDGPKNFQVQYWDGSTWVTVRTFTNVLWVNAGQTQRFPLYQNMPASDADFWRLHTTGKQNPGSFDAWAEIQLRKTSGGSDFSRTGWSYADSTNLGYPADNAFNNSTADKWQAGDGAVGHWIADCISSAGAITEIVATSSATANDSITAFDVDFWNGFEWETYWSVSTSAWSATQTRTFTKP